MDPFNEILFAEENIATVSRILVFAPVRRREDNIAISLYVEDRSVQDIGGEALVLPVRNTGP